ncbi:hypothetical protein [uncultured Ruminococcus sp.]|uniref:hypothetical protein n=1 Tax=uncultured Ruminococcus sp. TaxID=165186 RepID=UPI00260EA3DB|nr:hypothetical protein [uncultured Ruminococcus sp.]
MKKLITGISVLSVLAMSIVPLSVSAIYIPSASSEAIQKQLDGYTYITEFDVSENDPNYPSDYSLYIRIPEDSETFCEVKLLMKEDYDALNITIPDGNGRKVLSDAMQEAGINGKVFTDDDIKCECRIYNDISVGDVKALYSKLKESKLITEFVYSSDLYSIREGGTSNELLGKFGFCSYDYDTGKWTSPEEQLTKYNKLVEMAGTLLPGSAIELDSFTDKELGFTAYNASVVPADDMTIEEQIDFALKVKEETGIFGGYYINEKTAPALKIDSIDLINSVTGDSNCDGTVELADAILIMQSLANPDKYRISSQGRFNSDPGNDGITSGDALAIQETLLGLR